MSTRTDPTITTERLAWTGAIVVGASLPHWPDLELWIAGLLAACVAWRLAAVRFRWPLPPRPLRMLLAVAAFIGVLVEHRTINGVSAGSALLVVMVALKYLEARTHRDQLVLTIIAYFLLFAALLTERSLVMVAYVIALLWITTTALLQLGRPGSLTSSIATAKTAGRLLLHAVPITIVLFLLFPRLPGPLWAMPGNTSSGATGLSEQMSPGDITNLGLSDEVAFRVQFNGRPPTADRLYWRGPVMTHFNGRTWTRAEGMWRGERVKDSVEYFGTPTEYRVMLEPNNYGWAFAIDMPERWDGNRTLRMGSDYQLGGFLGGSRATRFDYRVTSYTDYRALEPLTDDQIELLRRLPADSSPRTRALVATWLIDEPTPEEIISRAMDWLRSQPFFYTLTPPALSAEQPVDHFLFETREGFCEHYASAFTVMLRAAGLPARIVTGYQGGELNTVGEYYIVRQSDAHAWTEVWIEDRGWIRVDPIVAVAPERVALGFSRLSLGDSRASGAAIARIPWIRSALLVWDAAHAYWNDWVVGYGPALQRALLERLGLERARRGQRWAMLFGLATVSTVALLLALSGYLAWRHRRVRAPDPAARYFARFCARLNRSRVPPRAPHEGPAAYGARAQRALPGAAADIGSIIDAYLRARYERDPERAALKDLRRRVAAFHPARV